MQSSHLASTAVYLFVRMCELQLPKTLVKSASGAKFFEELAAAVH